MFSVIIPVHNSWKTIDRTINKTLNSFIDINDEIILVNDNSNECTIQKLNYYSKYPNIRVINNLGVGVSDARNSGIEIINKKNEFVTFIDDSDWVSQSFFCEAKNFFQKEKEIDIVFTPIKIFKEGKIYEHTMNDKFKFNGNIINIFKNYQFVQYHIGGVIFRNTLLKNEKYRFDNTIDYWEDAKLINTILLNKQKYGMLKNSIYFYDRNDPNSLSNKAWLNKNRYLNHLKDNYMYLINQSKYKYGYVINYVQYLITKHYLNYLYYDNQNKMLEHNDEEFDEFKKESQLVFKNIDKKIIDLQPVPEVYKNYLYQLKNSTYFWKKNINHIHVYIHSISIIKRNIVFSFSDNSFFLSEDSSIYIKFKGKKIYEPKLKLVRNHLIFGKKVNDFSRQIFNVTIPIKFFFHDAIFVIEDKNNKIILNIKSKSIVKRILKRKNKLRDY